MSQVLTFDLGTTYFKVCLFNQQQRMVAQRRISVPIERPSSELAELPVVVFEQCLSAAVRDLNRQVGGLHNVTKACFASQANSFTLLDVNSRPLIPFLLWIDQRARGTEVLLECFRNRPHFYATTGLAHFDYQFMLAKISWLRTHQPATVERTRRLCGMSDYLVWWLTGNHLTETGLMGLTGLVDVQREHYWHVAAQHFGMPLEWLPQIVRAGSDAGRLRPVIAKDWGLPNDCRVVMGCLDQYAGAIGADNTEPGRVSETTGTVLATIRLAREFWSSAHPGVFQGPGFAQGTFYQMIFSSLSAGVLEKYRNSLPDRPTFAELDELAAAVPFGAEGLELHPDATNLAAAEMFIHRTENHHRGHEVRAIMEAVAYELRRHVVGLCGCEWPSSLRAAGGAARSQLWLQIKSQILGLPVEGVNCSEPTSLGAARLAHGFL